MSGKPYMQEQKKVECDAEQELESQPNYTERTRRMSE
jgi:hypothetical protein